MDVWSRMREQMADAGCSEAAIERAERLCERGASVELIRCLRACRCDALEQIHEKQRQLDRLDGLIRNVQHDLS